MSGDTYDFKTRENQSQMFTLPTRSLSRLSMLTKKRTVEDKTIKIAEAVENALTGYHLHPSAKEPDDPEVHAKQLHIFVTDNASFYVKYKRGDFIHRKVIDNRSFNANFDNIKRKLIDNTPLTSHEVKDVFAILQANLSLQTQKFPLQNTHPLLQTMDDYIISMQRKQKGGHVNVDMARDKIEFTKTLRTFVENPTENNWHNVRKAMSACPRYGFSWTGMSQVDYFLTIVKIQHVEQIDSFDNRYDATHKNEAKTSWGRFVYNFGFAYYIPSFFLALYKLVQFIYHEGARTYYESQIKYLRTKITTQGETFPSTRNFMQKANEIINKLETYLSEDDLEVTEDVVAYIDGIESHLDKLSSVADHNQTNLRASIRALANEIKALIPRPAPLRDMSYTQQISFVS